MADVCSNIIANPQELGFANDTDFKEFKAVLDNYEKVIAENRGKVGLFKVLAKNAMSKLVSDTLTASKAAANFRILQQDLQTAHPEIPNINEEEVIAATLLSARRFNRLEQTMFSGKQGVTKMSERVNKLADYIQSQNPIKKQEKIRRDLTKYLEQTRVKHSESPQFRTGRLEEPLLLGNEQVTNINEAMLVVNHEVWKAIEPQLKPKVTQAGVKRYEALDIEKAYTIVEKEIQKFDGMSDLDRQVLTDSLVGYYHLNNANVMRHQAEGVFIDWNENYVIPNFHDKAGMLINGMVGYGFDPKNPQPLTEYVAKAKHNFVESILPTLDLEKTFHSRNPDLKFKTEPQQKEYMMKRLEQIFDTMIGDLTTTGINDELAQLDNPALRLSSVNRKFTQKVLYFKDGASHYQYLKQMNEAIGRADAKEGQGFVLFDKLMQEGASLSKDLTMISTFGTNPTLTLRRFSPPSTNTKGSSNERKYITDIFSGDDTYSLRMFMFPTAENAIIDVKPEVFKQFKQILDADEKSLSSGGADIKATFKEAMALTSFEKSLANSIMQLPKEAIAGGLFLSNTLLDPFTVGLRLAEAQAVSIAALNPMSAGMDLMSTIFSYHTGNLFGAEAHDILKSKIARASGVDAKDVTKDVFAELLTKLGASVAFQRKMDVMTTLNRQADTQNVVSKGYQRARQSKLYNLLGGRDMTDVIAITEFNTRLLSSDMIMKTADRFINGEVDKVSPYMQEMRVKHNLKETDFGLLKEYFPDAFSGNTIDVTAFSKPVKRIEFNKIGVSEERFDNAYQDFYKNEWNKERQRVQLLIESREKQQALTTDEAQQLFGGQTLREMVEEQVVPFKDFIETFKEENPQQVNQWKQQFANDYVRNKTFALTGMYDEFANQLMTKSDDNGYIAKVMKGGTVKDKVTTAMVLHLKSFMMNSLKLEQEALTRGRSQGVPKLTRHVTGRLVAWGAAGLLYSTVLGLISGDRSGVMELIDDATDGDYTPEQRLAKSMSSITKMAAIGMPVGNLFTTMAYTMGNAKSVLDYASSVVLSPAPINTSRDISQLFKTVKNEARRGEETSRQEEARNKNYIKLIENVVRKTPVGNAVIPKLIMNYGVTPYLQEQAGITQEAYEREDARAEQVYDSNAVEIFFEDMWNMQTDTKTSWSPE